MGPEIRKALNEVAQVVVDEAKSSVPVRSGRLAGSIRAQSSQSSAKVVMGKANVPYAGFIEFGGWVGRNKMTKRNFIREGRYLYPAFIKHARRLNPMAMEVLSRVARRAGLT